MVTSDDLDDFKLLRFHQLLKRVEEKPPTDMTKEVIKVMKQIERWERKYSVFPLFMNILGLEIFEIIHYFEHQGRMCVIIRRNDAYDGFYHNGYVECHWTNYGNPYQPYQQICRSFELSDAGDLENYKPLPPDIQGKWYWGFTTYILSSFGYKYRHWGSFQNTLELTRKLAEQMVKHNV
jgi:hypothetical protein